MSNPVAYNSSPDDVRPVVIIDTREQCPLAIQRFETRRRKLPAGDYGIAGFSDWDNPAFVVERKSLEDLCGSLGRGRARFMREVELLRQFRFRGLVIEADRAQVEAADYRSLIHPASVFGSLDALAVRAGVHVAWAGSHAGAARQVEAWVQAFAVGVARDWRRIRGEAVLMDNKPRKG